MYKEFGKEGLKAKRNKTVYSVQFKLDVLNFMKGTDASLTDTALHFGLNNPSIISSWNKKILEGGVEALDKPRGRPSMNDKMKNGKKKQNKEMTHEQKLERENELLRLEVAYLKKLRAFQMDPKAYLEKHKQRYHSNSKKNSD